jgi:hypothetical protein
MHFEKLRSWPTPFEEVVVEIPDGTSVGHGDHWSVFIDDPPDFFKDIPSMLDEARPALTYADIRIARPYPLPDTEPKGVLLVWPIPRFGAIMAIELDASAGENRFVAMYPWMSDGVQHTVRLVRVHLWPSRLEAQLQGLVGAAANMPITFFDPLFAANRAFYRKGEEYQVIMVGFPYRFEISESKPVVIDDRSRVRGLRNAMHTDDPSRRDSEAPLVFDTKGMAALLPREDIAADAYEFRGPVKAVAELHTQMLGQRAWRVRVTVARLGDDDFDVDLCLTAKGARQRQTARDRRRRAGSSLVAGPFVDARSRDGMIAGKEAMPLSFFSLGVKKCLLECHIQAGAFRRNMIDSRSYGTT